MAVRRDPQGLLDVSEAMSRSGGHLGLPPRAPPVAPARLPGDDWEG
jgi:hypothetical protein